MTRSGINRDAKEEHGCGQGQNAQKKDRFVAINPMWKATAQEKTVTKNPGRYGGKESASGNRRRVEHAHQQRHQYLVSQNRADRNAYADDRDDEGIACRSLPIE